MTTPTIFASESSHWSYGKWDIVLRFIVEDLPLFNFEWQGKSLWVNSNVCFEVLSGCLFCNCVCISCLSSTKNVSNPDTGGFNAAIYSLNSFGFCWAIKGRNFQIQKIFKDLAKVYCSQTEKFAQRFTTNKLFLENSGS